MISVAIISYNIYPLSFLQWIMCKKWHIINGSRVSIGNADLKIPSNWWVVSNYEDKIGLCRISSNRNEIFGFIFFLRKNLSTDKLCQAEKIREVEGIRAEKTGEIETSRISDEIAYSIKYRIVSPPENSGKIIWTLSVPTQELVINIMYLDENEMPTVVSELFSQVRFRP